MYHAPPNSLYNIHYIPYHIPSYTVCYTSDIIFHSRTPCIKPYVPNITSIITFPILYPNMPHTLYLLSHPIYITPQYALVLFRHSPRLQIRVIPRTSQIINCIIGMVWHCQRINDNDSISQRTTTKICMLSITRMTLIQCS